MPNPRKSSSPNIARIQKEIARVEKEIVTFEEMASLAGTPGIGASWPAAVSATKEAAMLRRQLELLRYELTLGETPDPIDLMEISIRGAIGDGSWVAAERLTAAKVAMVKERDRVARETEAARLRELESGSLEDRVVAMLERMGASGRARIFARVTGTAAMSH